MKILGVDAGRTGAYAMFDTTANSLTVGDLPTDDDGLQAQKFFQTILEWEPDVLVTEDTFQPKSLVRMTGEVVALGKLAVAIVEVVAVVTWKKRVLGENSSDKSLSIAKAKELFPDVDLMRPRARKPSHDRAEAVNLAWYYHDLHRP